MRRTDLSREEELAAELAKGIVAFAVRNGPIENIHAGAICPTCSANDAYSHITQTEMKALMKFAVDRVYLALRVLSQGVPDADMHMQRLLRIARLFADQWDDPEPVELKEMDWSFITE